MHCFAFDIETVPDIDAGRRIWGLDGLSDEDVVTVGNYELKDGMSVREGS